MFLIFVQTFLQFGRPFFENSQKNNLKTFSLFNLLLIIYTCLYFTKDKQDHSQPISIGYEVFTILFTIVYSVYTVYTIVKIQNTAETDLAEEPAQEEEQPQETGQKQLRIRKKNNKKRVRFAIENSEQAAQDQISSPIINLQPIVMESSEEQIQSPKTQLEASPGKKKEKLEKDQANITIDLREFEIKKPNITLRTGPGLRQRTLTNNKSLSKSTL